MSRTRSRSDSIREDEELRLPRPPGVLRRFWARHPVVADVLIAGLCLLISLASVRGTVVTASQPVTALDYIAPAAAVLASVALLWRRRAPLIPFVAAISVEVISLLALRPGGSPVVLAAAYALAVYGSTRAAWIGYGVGVATVTGVALPLIGLGALTWENGINPILNAAVLGLIGTLIGVNVGGRKRYIAAVIDRSRQLLVERDQQAQLAAAAERARIAREMHDIVSHSLTVIVALSEGAAATPDAEQARMASTAAAETARGALTEMRSMLGVLRDHDSPLPLAPMDPTPPRETVAAAQRAGYPVTLTVTGTADVSPTVTHAVSRIVQEGVTNAMRHAPAATAITVRLGYGAEQVTIEIDNDGVSGPIGGDGFGMRGLAERAAHVGGTFHSAPAGQDGWALRAVLPTGSSAAEQATTVEETS